MSSYCCVDGCLNNLNTPGIVLHYLPTSDAKLEKWKAALTKDQNKPFEFVFKYSRICSAHFDDTQFTMENEMKHLMKGAVPSRFPWTHTNECERAMTETSQFESKQLPEPEPEIATLISNPVRQYLMSKGRPTPEDDIAKCPTSVYYHSDDHQLSKNKTAPPLSAKRKRRSESPDSPKTIRTEGPANFRTGSAYIYRCCVPGCLNTSATCSPDITFHLRPGSRMLTNLELEARIKEWTDVLTEGRSGYVHNILNRICSVHFGESTFIYKDRTENDPFRICAFPDCSVQKRLNVPTNKRRLSWHNLPHKCGVRRQWIEIIRKARRDSGWSPTPSTVVCSRHFCEDSFVKNKQFNFLLNNARPTLFIGNGETPAETPEINTTFSDKVDKEIPVTIPIKFSGDLKNIPSSLEEATNSLGSGKSESQTEKIRRLDYCLLCLKKSSYKMLSAEDLQTGRPLYKGKTKISPSSHNDNNSEWNIPSDQTDLTFLLRKLLDMPGNTINELLQPNPLPTIYCCDYCISVVKSARSLCTQIVLLEERYRNLETEVKNIIVDSMKSQEKVDIGTAAGVRTYIIEKFCATSSNQNFEKDPNNDDFPETDKCTIVYYDKDPRAVKMSMDTNGRRDPSMQSTKASPPRAKKITPELRPLLSRNSPISPYSCCAPGCSNTSTNCAPGSITFQARPSSAQDPSKRVCSVHFGESSFIVGGIKLQKQCIFPDCSTQKRIDAVASTEGFYLSWHGIGNVQQRQNSTNINKWIEVIRKARKDDEWNPDTHHNCTFVCSRHFDEESFIRAPRFPRMAVLKKDAIPTLFTGCDEEVNMDSKTKTAKRQYSSWSKKKIISNSSTNEVDEFAKHTNVVVEDSGTSVLICLPEIKTEQFEYEDVAGWDPVSLNPQCTNASVPLVVQEYSPLPLDRGNQKTAIRTPERNSKSLT